MIFSLIFCLFFYFETRPHYVVQAGLNSLHISGQLQTHNPCAFTPLNWDCRCEAHLEGDKIFRYWNSIGADWFLKQTNREMLRKTCKWPAGEEQSQMMHRIGWRDVSTVREILRNETEMLSRDTQHRLPPFPSLTCSTGPALPFWLG